MRRSKWPHGNVRLLLYTKRVINDISFSIYDSSLYFLNRLRSRITTLLPSEHYAFLGLCQRFLRVITFNLYCAYFTTPPPKKKIRYDRVLDSPKRKKRPLPRVQPVLNGVKVKRSETFRRALTLRISISNDILGLKADLSKTICLHRNGVVLDIQGEY